MHPRELCKRAQIHQQTNKSTDAIATQKKDYRQLPKLTYATQSNPSPPAFTTVPFDPWKFFDQEIEIEIKDINGNVVNSEQEPDRFPIHRITELAAVVIGRRNTEFLRRNENSNHSPRSAAPPNLIRNKRSKFQKSEPPHNFMEARPLKRNFYGSKSSPN